MLQKRTSPGLGHASKKTEDDMRTLLRHPSEHPHFAERLLVGHIPHTAGVEQDYISLGLMRYPFISSADQGMRDLFRVPLVHLAPVSLNEEFRHGWAEIIHRRACSATSSLGRAIIHFQASASF